MKRYFYMLSVLVIMLLYGCVQSSSVHTQTGLVLPDAPKSSTGTLNERINKIMVVDYLNNKVVFSMTTPGDPKTIPYMDGSFKTGLQTNFSLSKKVASQSEPGNTELNILIKSVPMANKIEIQEELVLKTGEVNIFSQIVFWDNKPYLLVVIMDDTNQNQAEPSERKPAPMNPYQVK